MTKPSTVPTQLALLGLFRRASKRSGQAAPLFENPWILRYSPKTTMASPVSKLLPFQEDLAPFSTGSRGEIRNPPRRDTKEHHLPPIVLVP